MARSRRMLTATLGTLLLIASACSTGDTDSGSADGGSQASEQSTSPTPDDQAAADDVADGAEDAGDELSGDEASGDTASGDESDADQQDPAAGADDEPGDAAAGGSSPTWAGLGGNANPKFPTSDEDFIVVSGAYNQIATTANWDVAVIAKNHTDHTVYNMTAAVTATDSSGAEVKPIGPSQMQPYVVEPGGLAMATVMITGEELDGTETITVAISSNAEPNDDQVDLQPSDVSYDADADAVVGTVTNTADQVLESPLMLVLGCFADNGEILGIVQDIVLDDLQLAPGDGADVDISPGFYIKDCPTYLLAASASIPVG